MARRRGDRLELLRPTPELLARADELARAYLAAVDVEAAPTRAEVEARWREVDFGPREKKLADGLRKLVEDRCRFEADDGVAPVELRRALFSRAADVRRELPADAEFSREQVVAEVAASHELSADALEDRLFGDLRSAHRLVGFEPVAPDELVRRWRYGQGQAVLLKATRIVVDVAAESPHAYRALFHKLKFLRLLFAIEPLEGDDGYRITVDGPFSLFQSVTKYGLQLAMLLPTLDECCRWQLAAEVRWGFDKRALTFLLQGGRADAGGSTPVRPSDDIATLVKQFGKLKSGWRVEPSARVLHLPGAGLCVPDLEFTHEDGTVVHLEVLGFWSREAVWRRVELVEAGLPDRIVFAVSERLRVSEAVLKGDLPGSLYVYKGVMSARRIRERLDATRDGE